MGSRHPAWPTRFRRSLKGLKWRIEGSGRRVDPWYAAPLGAFFDVKSQREEK
jgi:hypothetical protein